MHSRLFRLSLFLFISHTKAVVLNRTIDDGYGDPVTGKMPIYFPPSKPESPWNNQTCGGCAIQPNLNMTHRRTYTAATYHPFLQNMSITLDFTGIAVWVFFINANNAGISVTTMTLANFTLDDQPPHLYQHVPDMTRTDDDFNAVAYQQDGLTNTPHRLLISTTGDSDAYVNFDFAIYSFDDEIPPLTSSQVQSSNTISSITTSPTTTATEAPDPGKSQIGTIVGGSIGGCVLILLGAIFFIVLSRRRRRGLADGEQNGGRTSGMAQATPFPSASGHLIAPTLSGPRCTCPGGDCRGKTCGYSVVPSGSAGSNLYAGRNAVRAKRRSEEPPPRYEEVG